MDLKHFRVRIQRVTKQILMMAGSTAQLGTQPHSTQTTADMESRSASASRPWSLSRAIVSHKAGQIPEEPSTISPEAQGISNEYVSNQLPTHLLYVPYMKLMSA
ncbi:hypothetical protein BV22DRAFT_155515 [Leucogyrophana mollusca]|uniref:Uncharacterized protein n=1 Tax=Leucogyrophana mollusca TaxID=85980 RepID=A0ACB8BTT2_9AGAM|nr:hypothetical protein BV22DRAFT_155515 [Leucogyrophana mollusca]